MKIIRTKPQRLFCPTCNETYTLPQRGTIKLYKEIKCPLDDFELVLFSLGNSVGYQGMSTPLCPQCYNNPPFEDYKGTMTCIQCRNTSCVHSMVNNAICEYILIYYYLFIINSCPEIINEVRCQGKLVLDTNSKPNWKLNCNTCNLLITFKCPIHDISISGKCEDCGCKMVTIEFHKDHSPLEEGKTTYFGCLICDDFLNSITETVAGRSTHASMRRGGGRGRGRGRRGGRGRGRGRGRGDKGGDPRLTADGF